MDVPPVCAGCGLAIYRHKGSGLDLRYIPPLTLRVRFLYDTEGAYVDHEFHDRSCLVLWALEQ